MRPGVGSVPRPCLRATSSAEAFVLDPWGAYVAGRSWLNFSSVGTRFSGLLLWGEPDESDIEQAVRVLESHAAYSAHLSVVDTRAVEHIDPLAFARLSAFFTSEGERLRPVIARAAVLHGDGLAGAVTAGFAAALVLPFPVAAFREPADAMEWLGDGVDEAAFEDATRVVTTARTSGHVLARLRGLLDIDLTITLAAAAAQLALSTRSLQRKLGSEGTSFHHELELARVRVATRLLATSGANVTRVAQRVGMGSPQALASLFRRVVGQTPAAFRRPESR
jgi:AraC-like DNA-binding protein